MPPLPPTTHVASPCISVCVMDEPSGLCSGCFRTIDEIAVWSMLDDSERRAVLAEVEERRAAGNGAADRSTTDIDANG